MGWKNILIKISSKFLRIRNATMVSNKTTSTATTTVNIKGKPKSGRVWKSAGKKRSDMICVKPFHKSWARRQQERVDKKSIKAFENELTEEKKQAKQDKRKRKE